MTIWGWNSLPDHDFLVRHTCYPDICDIRVTVVLGDYLGVEHTLSCNTIPTILTNSPYKNTIIRCESMNLRRYSTNNEQT